MPVISLLALTYTAHSQTFIGTNQPGAGSLYSFGVPGGVTNLSLTVSNSSTTFSYLFLKVGGEASMTNYDFASRLDRTNNNINLELPELVSSTNYTLWVQTPTNSLTHGFTVSLSTNRLDARLASMPILKPLTFSVSGTLSAGDMNFFQIDVPTNLVGWRLVLTASGTADPDIYLQRGFLPSTTSYLKGSVNRTIDTLFLNNLEATNGTYFVLVTIPKTETGNATYTLQTEVAPIVNLVWDPGTSATRLNVFTNQSLIGGDYFFKITTQNADSGIWRTRLDVQSGEADLYLMQGSLPSPASYGYASTRAGSDGLALVQGGQFQAGQTWYAMVTTLPGAQWSIYSGNLFIPQLAPPALDTTGTTNDLIGPEGMNFYSVTMSSNAIAWRLGLGGLTNTLYVRKGAVAHPYSATYYDWKQPGQTLLVPPYLKQNTQYFVTVTGTVGQSFTLDSRQQAITELPFGGRADLAATDYGYITFHVFVTNAVLPLAWQLDLGAPSGNPSLAVRLSAVANEYVNAAYSEKTNAPFQSLTLVPPALADGSYYITIYGTPPFTASLTNSTPVITDEPYAFSVANDQPDRQGWRFYRVTDITSQLNSVGWDLLLSGQVPGTEITLRRNAVPGRWNSRTNYTQGTSSTVVTDLDASSFKGFLQTPRHAADIWYIGINHTNQPLGAFVLTSRESLHPVLTLGADFTTNHVADQPAALVDYYQIDVPTNALGLELRLVNVSSGDPRLSVCRDLLPLDFSTILINTNLWSPNTATTWPSGAQIAYNTDWTGYTIDARGTNETGRFFFASQGNPLQPGTYFVAVLSGGTSTNAMNYDLLARGVFSDSSFTDLGAGSSNSGAGLGPHDIIWHRVSVPTNMPSWRFQLNMTSGEGMLVLREVGLPNYGASLSISPTNVAGCKLQKLGNEHFVMLPYYPGSNLVAGTYYLGVVAEGQNPNSSRAGSNTCSFTLTSEGPLALVDVGPVDPLGLADIVLEQVQQGGETRGFRFTIVSNTPVIEVRLRNRTGNPRMTLRADTQLPSLSDSYGFSGGWPATWADPQLIRIPTPLPGSYTLLVQAANISGQYSNASYSVEISAQQPQPLAFDNGSYSITNQPLDAWSYFLVNVPPGVLGWDLRLINVTSGDPRLVICRDLVPFNLSTRTIAGFPWALFTSTNWPSGSQFGPGTDWTGYSYSYLGTNETGRFFTLGMGNPLEPGNYIVGVASGGSPGSATNLNYQLLSRGIGTNLAIPVVPLAFAGGQSNVAGLLPHDAAFYSIDLPTNMPSWQVRLAMSRGEAMLAIRKGGLPNAGAAVTTPVTNLAGCKLQKTGNEQFALLANPPAFDIPAGTYYLAVVSEGMSPSSGLSRIGSNSCDYALQSIGTLPVHDAGTVNPSSFFEQNIVQEGGSVLAYQFNVDPGTVGVVVRLDNRVNNPAMTLRAGPILPRSLDGYGRQGGWTEDSSSATRIQLHTIAGGGYSVLIQAENVAGQYPDASYTLRILPLEYYITPLPFDGGQVTLAGHLAGEWQYFSVDVPTNALGWDLRLANITSGSPRLVICRSDWPVDLTSRLASGASWNWGASSNWPVSAQAAPGVDWTGYRYTPNKVDTTGTIFAAGMGSPVEPGQYVVGVSSAPGTTTSMSYTIMSRGIGGNFTLPVTPIASGSSSVPVAALNPREAAYFSLHVPTNTPLWKLRLAPSSGEALLAVRQGALPNVTTTTNVLASVLGGGHKFQKFGSENALFGPLTGQAFVAAGDYYLAVVGEGNSPQLGTNGIGTTDCLLTSILPSSGTDLGQVGSADILITNSLDAGETAAYQFTMPPGGLGLSVSLENITGNSFMRLRSDGNMPLDVSAYGQDGGYRGFWENNSRISLTSPTSGVYTVTVLATGTGTNWPPLQYTLRVHADLRLQLLSFDGGSIAVSNQFDLWQVFQVTVPSNSLGWDLRLVNVSNGAPRLVIARDQAPANLNSHPELYHMTNWPSTWQLAPDVDWTALNNPDGSSSTGRVFQVGMGNPLQPGTYYIGVTNLNNTNAAFYTLVSRGIGSGFSVPVTDLPFNSGAAANALPAREAAWYRFTVPSNTPAWKLALNIGSGDGLLLAQQGVLPSVAAYITNGLSIYAGGKKMQKLGDEQLLVLASGVGASTNVPAGTYFVGVVSEGLNPSNSVGRIGAGSNSFTLYSLGSPSPFDLGSVGSQDLLAQASLQGGECGTYRFSIPAGILAAEIDFEQTNGSPVMTLAPGSYPPMAPLRYGADGGASIQVQSSNVITIANPPPTNFSVTVQATPMGAFYSNADFNLRIRSLPILDLNFDSQLNTNGLSNSGFALLADGHRNYYRVQVPQILDGQPVIGWKLSLSTVYGGPLMRVRRDALPDDSAAGTSAYFPRQAVFVPDYLTPGTWYVEVKANGLTDYTLTSESLQLVRPAWQMPAFGEPVTTPGLPASGSFFGDSGIDTNGVPLPNDQGTDLETDSFDYYAVVVPAGNIGLLRTELDAISGNANLYLRALAPPTLSHNASGGGGPLYDRALTNSVGTEYGNWVVLDGKSASALTPGTWYIAVHAAWGSSIRYRLRVSTGAITDLPFAPASLSQQNLVAGDWRYYRVALPTNMTYSWTISFGEQQGNVSLYVRDTVPPGQGLADSDYVDWFRDGKNHGPYLAYPTPGSYTLTVPPVRPGNVYYLGVRALSDASISLTTTPGTTPIALDGILAFKDGFVTNQIAPGGILRYRIDVPPEARRWSHSAVHSSSVRLYLDQGSLPTLTSADDWFSTVANSTNNKALYNSSWPWLPGYMYFLTVTNTTTSIQPFSFTMDGRDCNTDDFNNDGIPDCWEIYYFGSIYTYGSNSDPDGDGLSNLQEFLAGTDPTKPDYNFIKLFSTAATTGGKFSLSAIAVMNRSYRLQASATLLPGSWIDVTNFVQTAPVQMVVVPSLPGQPAEFYRVIYP